MIRGYSLGDLLGRGAAGVVWAATRDVDGVAVAVKVLPAEGPGLLREVALAASLRHPNVIRVLDAGALEQDAERDGEHLPAGAPFVVTERAAASLQSRRGDMDAVELRATALALLDGLAHAHARGVLHRDLKPANVLVVAGRPVLADFGVGRRTTDMDHAGRVGTRGYAAPEQWAGRRSEEGPWSDVYAVGATIRALAAPSALRGGLRSFVDRASAVDPHARYRCAADAAAALRAVLPERGDAVPRRPSAADSDTATGTGPLGLDGADGPSTELPPTLDPAPWTADWRSATDSSAGLRPSPTGVAVVAHAAHAFVGRDEERDVLWAALRGVWERGGGHTVVVSGPPGSGRSALAGWLATRADELGLARPIRVDGRRGLRAELVAPSRSAVAAWLGRRSLDRPALLVVDDADLDPDATALEDAPPVPGRGALVVLIVGRHVPGALALGPLDDLAHHQLLRELLGLDEALAGAIHARTRGDPSLAVAWIRELAATGALSPRAGGLVLADGVELAPPEPLAAGVRRRVDALSPGARTRLALAACLGPRAAPGELDAAARAFGAASDEPTDLLDDGAVPTLVAEVVRSTSTPSELAALHAACAEVVTDAERLAVHQARAGRLDAAVPGLLEAARSRIADRHTWRAFELLDEVERCLAGTHAWRPQVASLRARALVRANRRVEAVAAWALAEEAAVQAGDATVADRARAGRAEVLGSLGRFAEALAAAGGEGPRWAYVRGSLRAQAGDHAAALDDLRDAANGLSPIGRVSAQRLACLVAHRLGLRDEAYALAAMARDGARSDVARADTALALADLRLSDGDFIGAKSFCDEAMALRRSAGVPLGAALSTLALVELRAGNTTAARRLFLEATDGGDDRVRADASVGLLATALADGSATELRSRLPAVERESVEAWEFELRERVAATVAVPPAWVPVDLAQRLAALGRRAT